MSDMTEILEQEVTKLREQVRALNQQNEELMDDFGRIQNEELRMREELLQKTLFLDAILNSELDLYFKDTQSRFLLVSRGTAVKLAGEGARARDLVGKSDLDFFDREHAEAARRDEVVIMKRGKGLTREETEIYPDGTRRYALTTKYPLLDPTGTLVGTYGVTRDITDLIHLRRQIEAILTTTREAILLLDDHDRIVMANPAVETIFGFATEEVLGKPLEILLGEVRSEGEAAVLESLHAAMRSGSGQTSELMAARKTGDPVPIELSVNSVQIDGSRFAVGIARDITERREAQLRLRLMAEQDGLTGLYSQGAFPQKLREALARAESGKFAVIVADLDRFKPVNDHYGHAAGDRVLRLIARRLKESVKATDVVGRIGGDEFGLGLDLRGITDPGEVDRILTRRLGEIRHRVSQCYQIEDPSGGQPIRIDDLGISLGYAVFGRDADNVEALIRVADQRMYTAKMMTRCSV